MKSVNKRINRLAQPKPDSDDRVLGIDPSLSSLGYAYRHEGVLFTGRLDPKKLTGPNRLSFMRARLTELLDFVQPRYICYEDYAHGAAQGAHQLGELGGVLRLLIWERGIDVFYVSPTGLKKAVVGKGNADRGSHMRHKPEMRAAILSKFGYDLDQNDEADAFALMVLGEIRFGVGPLPLSVRAQLRLESVADFKVVKGKGADLKLIAK